MDEEAEDTEPQTGAERAAKNARKSQALAMLKAGHPITHVAKAVGAGRRTVHRWRDAHADEIKAHAEEVANDIASQLQALNDRAVKALRELVDDVSDPKVRLQAARTILSRAGYPEGAEVEVRDRRIAHMSDAELREELRKQLEKLGEADAIEAEGEEVGDDG